MNSLAELSFEDVLPMDSVLVLTSQLVNQPESTSPLARISVSPAYPVRLDHILPPTRNGSSTSSLSSGTVCRPPLLRHLAWCASIETHVPTAISPGSSRRFSVARGKAKSS